MFNWLLNLLFDKIAERRFTRPKNQRVFIIVEVTKENMSDWRDDIGNIHIIDERSGPEDCAKAAFGDVEMEHIFTDTTGEYGPSFQIVKHPKTGKLYRIMKRTAFNHAPTE